jgi:hypothetical protein
VGGLKNSILALTLALNHGCDTVFLITSKISEGNDSISGDDII